MIPIKKDGNLQEAFTIRLPELKVVDIAFLYESTTPTFAVLYEDTKENRHVKTYQLLMKEKELVQGPWSQDYLDLGSSVVIPIRGTNGAVVIGSQAAVFVSKEGICSTTIGPTFIKVFLLSSLRAEKKSMIMIYFFFSYEYRGNTLQFS